MRALIVLQPWAGLIAAGLKTIEFRNRPVRLRERVAVYAASSHCAYGPIGKWCYACRYTEPWPCEDRRGKVLCLATLADCRPVTEADRACPDCPDDLSGWAWVLEDLRALDPIPCKPLRGAQTWFHLPPEVEAAINAQLEASHD